MEMPSSLTPESSRTARAFQNFELPNMRSQATGVWLTRRRAMRLTHLSSRTVWWYIRQRTWVIGRSARGGCGLTASTRLDGVRRWPLPARGVLVQHQNDRLSGLGFGLSFTAFISLQPPRVPTMATTSQRQAGRDDALSKLNEAIGDLDRAKEESSIPPAKAVFASTSALLPTIRVSSVSIRV